jgi:hypothetical protein
LDGTFTRELPNARGVQQRSRPMGGFFVPELFTENQKHKRCRVIPENLAQQFPATKRRQTQQPRTQ